MSTLKLVMRLFLVLTAAAVVGCAGSRNDLAINASVTDGELVLSITNNLSESVSVHDRLFELGTTDPPRIEIQLANEDGTIRRQCSAVQYNELPKMLVIPPGTTLVRRVDLAYVKGVFCAEAGKKYYVKALLLDETGAVDSRVKLPSVLPIVFVDQRSPRT
jgi:hypothetical protein